MENKKTGLEWRQAQRVRHREIAERVRQMDKDGLTSSEIASKLRLPISTVLGIKKDIGILTI